MTEVVTNTAATLQQTLVAERQQRAVSASGTNQEASPQSNTPVRPIGAQAADAVARSTRPDQTQADGQRKNKQAVEQPIKRQAPDPVDEVRASRSETTPRTDRLEPKDFDVGRRPAEVVGTVDVVQRFDNNADGRVDLLESQRAVRARDGSSTYAARGQAHADTPSVAERVQDREIEQAVSSQATSQVQAATNAAPPPTGPTVEAQAEATGVAPAETQKIYGDAQVVSGGSAEDGTVPKKLFAAEEIASQGTFSDGAPVQQKFFGEGVEIVRGRVAGDPEVQQKLFDKAETAETGRFYEDGTGEQKLYDKVAQSEAGRFYEDPAERKLYDDAQQEAAVSLPGDPATEDQSLYEKAQQVAAQSGLTSAEEQQPKKLYGELDLYSDVAGLGDEAVDVEVPVSAPITA